MGSLLANLSVGSPRSTRSQGTMRVCMSARSLCGRPIDAERLMPAPEAERLRAKGEKEMYLQSARDSRRMLKDQQRGEEEIRREMLKRVEQQRNEEKERKAEEVQRRRLWSIEERRQQAEIRVQEREQDRQQAMMSSSNNRLSPRSSRATSPRGAPAPQAGSMERLEPSREERRQLEERTLREKADKQYEIEKAKEVRKLEREQRTQQKGKVKVGFEQSLKTIDVARESMHQQDQLKKKRAKERREVQAEARATHRLSQVEEAAAKETREHQKQVQMRMKKEQEVEEAKMLEMQMAGERERLMQEARMLRMKERQLQQRQHQLSQASVEDKTKRLFEAKERKKKEDQLRRSLDIERRQGHAEVQRVERERKKCDEADKPSDYFVPPIQKAKIVDGMVPMLLGHSEIGGP